MGEINELFYPEQTNLIEQSTREKQEKINKMLIEYKKLKIDKLTSRIM